MLLTRCYLSDGEPVVVRDKRIKELPSKAVLRPSRGFSKSLVVLNEFGCPLGWIAIEDIEGGKFKSVREWMTAHQIPIR